MSEDQDHVHDIDGEEHRSSLSRLRRKRLYLAGAGAIVVFAVAGVWNARIHLANDLVARELKARGISATYEIVKISPQEQIVRNLVVGNPERPDLTAQELRIATQVRWGLPGIGRITVVKPRLRASIKNGTLSLGSLDPVLQRQGANSSGLPDWDIRIIDGGALITSDYGKAALTFAGVGNLAESFTGKSALFAPQLQVQGCDTGNVAWQGAVSTEAQKLQLRGPLQVANLRCDTLALHVPKLQSGLTIRLSADWKTVDADVDLHSGTVVLGEQKARAFQATGRATFKDGQFKAGYRLRAKSVVTPYVDMAHLLVDGSIVGDGQRFDMDGMVDGRELRSGHHTNVLLENGQQDVQGTLAAPLLSQIRTSLAQETRKSHLQASFVSRNSDQKLSVMVPQASLKGGSGEALLNLSRVQSLFKGDNAYVAGNFTTGGRGLPQIWGRMEAGKNNRLSLQMAMSEYRAGDAMLAIPRMSVQQDKRGTFDFAGHVFASGAIPGGAVKNLLMPVDGLVTSKGDWSLWEKCTDIRFDELRFADLAVDKRSLHLCPHGTRAIAQSHGGHTQVALATPNLTLSGHMGQSPAQISSGPMTFAYGQNAKGTFHASNVQMLLGPVHEASRFYVDTISGQMGDGLSGTFQGGDFALAAVPLNMKQAQGQWQYKQGIASVTDAAFLVLDRQTTPRFQPFISRDGRLQLVGSHISAHALLREAKTDRGIFEAQIEHDLNTSSGHADLRVQGLRFDNTLQPYQLTASMLGVVSDVQGVVQGTGRIDWNAKGVISRGHFATQGLDLAAALGPVKGLSGEVEFTDLLGMVTAPKQVLHIASMNPGVEVENGTLSYELKPNYHLQINGATWPFMNGTLDLDPSHMNIGAAEVRNYTLRVTGLDAATFVQHLELDNVSASGTFDGELPLVFDENGGRVENGFLVSRAPGGTVSYIGALTYKDLSAMGNFAFSALKSVNYRNMEIGLDGSLAGDIVTRISFDGLSQGAGTKQNFLAKQIAKLPIRFVLNIKAPFFSLFGSMRSLYDPSYVTDPRQLGLLPGGPHEALGQSQDVKAPVSENKR